MRNSAAQEERRSSKVRDWLLAILRFAVTLAQADRATALAVAKDMDQSRSRSDRTAFSFFTRTTVELCNAIADKNDPRRVASLSRLLGRIEDDRIRRALETAIEFEQAAPSLPKTRRRDREYLWKGLRHKGTA